MLQLLLGDFFGVVNRTDPSGNPGFYYNLTGVGTSIVVLIMFLNEVVLTATLGGQLGKLILGLRVASVQNGRIPAGFGPLLLRWLIIGVAFMLCFLPGFVLFLSPLWGGPWQLGLHDKPVNTVVVKRPR